MFLGVRGASPTSEIFNFGAPGAVLAINRISGFMEMLDLGLFQFLDGAGNYTKDPLEV